MDIESFIWGVLPALIGLFILFKSIQITNKKRTFINWSLTALILISIGLAEIILFAIFIQGSWPTFIPHLLIGWTIILLGIQLLFNKTNANRIKR